MIKIKQLPKSRVELTISVPAQELERFLDLAAEELSKDINVNGFRPGKAPRKIIEQKVGSEKILAHGAEKAIKKSYVDSIVRNKIEAIGEPEVTITKIAPGNNLEYKAVVSVMPKITLTDYRKEAKQIKKIDSVNIKPGQVDKEIENLRQSRARLITVDREARKGDRVEIDFRVLVDGQEIKDGVSKNHPLVIGENYFIPGFEDRLLGMKEGEEKKFDLSFPKDYHQKELAGQLARFEVRMNLVQERQLPKADDEFAISLGKFESLEKLKESLKEGLELEEKKKNQDKRRIKIIEKISKSSQMDVPDILLENELEKMLGEFEQNITQTGMDLDAYLNYIKKTREEIKKDWRIPALNRVKAALILKEIARKENIEVESREIESEMNKVLAYYENTGAMKKNVDMESLYNYTKGNLLNEKVFQFLENL